MTNRGLINEDDPDIAESVRICFQNYKVETRVVYTGEDGLTASLDKSNPPSAIILDLLLPGDARCLCLIGSTGVMVNTSTSSLKSNREELVFHLVNCFVVNLL